MSKKDTKPVVKNGMNGHGTPVEKAKLLDFTKQEEPVKLESALPVIDQNTQDIPMSPEQAAKVKNFEQTILNAKVQLSDLEMNLLQIQAKKNEVVDFIRAQHQKMLDEVRSIAQSYGIDVDGVKDDRKWNLDTADMVFHRVK